MQYKREALDIAELTGGISIVSSREFSAFLVRHPCCWRHFSSRGCVDALIHASIGNDAEGNSTFCIRKHEPSD